MTSANHDRPPPLVRRVPLGYDPRGEGAGTRLSARMQQFSSAGMPVTDKMAKASRSSPGGLSDGQEEAKTGCPRTAETATEAAAGNNPRGGRLRHPLRRFGREPPVRSRAFCPCLSWFVGSAPRWRPARAWGPPARQDEPGTAARLERWAATQLERWSAEGEGQGWFPIPRLAQVNSVSDPTRCWWRRAGEFSVPPAEAR